MHTNGGKESRQTDFDRDRRHISIAFLPKDSLSYSGITSASGKVSTKEKSLMPDVFGKSGIRHL